MNSRRHGFSVEAHPVVGFFGMELVFADQFFHDDAGGRGTGKPPARRFFQIR